MVRLCAQILSNGKTCARIPCKGELYCPAHRNPDRREQADYDRCVVESIPDMDVISLATVLADTLTDLRTRRTTPLNAQAVFTAAATHLQNLQELYESLKPADSDSYSEASNEMK